MGCNFANEPNSDVGAALRFKATLGRLGWIEKTNPSAVSFCGTRKNEAKSREFALLRFEATPRLCRRLKKQSQLAAAETNRSARGSFLEYEPNGER